MVFVVCFLVVITLRIVTIFIYMIILYLFVYLQDAYAEPGQDSRNIAGLEIVVIVQDVQDQPPVFTSAPPVTKLPPGILPGDKVIKLIIQINQN